MNLTSPPVPADLLCPDIRPYWQIAQRPNCDQTILLSKDGNTQLRFTGTEGFALRHFTGTLTLGQIQERCQQEYPTADHNLVFILLQKLITLGILSTDTEAPAPTGPQLKPEVHWIAHPDGHWLLRNPEDVTFLQVSDRDKQVIDQLGYLPTAAISQEFCIAPSELNYLLKLLAATGMLVGTTPAKPPRRKFSPLQLLFFRIPLFNPDPWLTQHIDGWRWLWTKLMAFFVISFLTLSAIVGIHHTPEIVYSGRQLWEYQGASLLIPFILLTTLVVSLHELGHAFTLKHYGGIVPEMGLLFICLMPAAYTNTTDSYSLPRTQRVLVVAAGIIMQFILAAIALWTWQLTAQGSGLHILSYLLMVAALVSVAINLNPLAKFDGYYLAVSLTGINNLRSRAFEFYQHLFMLKSPREKPKDALVLAIYAPLSLLYIWMVFGYLFCKIFDWTFTNIPVTAAILFILWLIYFYSPSSEK